jgi:hypothetical protein
MASWNVTSFIEFIEYFDIVHEDVKDEKVCIFIEWVKCMGMVF